ncbi:glycosyltransferase family 4 protein [Planctomycetaceae bacterium SH139]
MRVAHLITRMIIGGAQENTLFNCLDLIRQHGDEVLLITGPALGPEGDLLSQGRGGELPVRKLDSLRRSLHPLRDWRAFREITQVLKEFRPDVVHTHSAKAGILGREAAWRLAVPAIVHTVHGAPFHPFQSAAVRAFYRTCERHAAKRCHRLISVAEAMTDLMVTGGVAPREQFVKIFSGMDVEPLLAANQYRQQIRDQLGFAEDDVVFIKIARLFHLKGHADLIRAAQLALGEDRRARFLLVGDGILRPQLVAEVQRLGLEQRFHFAGLVDPREIPKYLSAADALVHTSYREGLARALPQALISGHPAISYDIDGAREVVLDGRTGFLVAPGDIDALAERIARLTADAALRTAQGRAGQQEFTELFRHQTMTERIRELYTQILSKG